MAAAQAVTVEGPRRRKRVRVGAKGMDNAAGTEEAQTVQGGTVEDREGREHGEGREHREHREHRKGRKDVKNVKNKEIVEDTTDVAYVRELMNRLENRVGVQEVGKIEKLAKGRKGRRVLVENGAVEKLCEIVRPTAVGMWAQGATSKGNVVLGISAMRSRLNELDKKDGKRAKGSQRAREKGSSTTSATWQAEKGAETAEGAAEGEGSLSSTTPSEVGLDRTMWDGVIAIVSKLCLFEVEACRRVLECGGLELLAIAAREGEPRATRLKATAALAAVGVWSGPRRAVEIVETPLFVESLCAVLKNTSNLSVHLQGAICDALNALSHRHRAREIMRSKGCEKTFRSVARRASANGDYVTAGRASVAAGLLLGHSIDEYGFLVENDSSRSTIDLDDELFKFEVGRRSPRYGNGAFRAQEDPYTRSPDIDKLRDSAFQGQDTSSSNPRDSYKSQTARAADWCAVDQQQEGRTGREESLKERHVRTSTGPKKGESLQMNGYGETRSSVTVDKSDDPDADNDSPTGQRRKSRLSPLQVFSQSARRGMEHTIPSRRRKSEGQISREQQAAYVWTDVLENRPNDLTRINGKTSRVKAYRELALVPIPQHMRLKVWAVLLNVAELKRKDPDIYSRLGRQADQSLSADSIHTIDVDVVRTMPSHSLFWAGGAAMGVDSLRSVLRAYAVYAPDVGYCQGMSSVAALLLMNSKDEEEAFLMFVQFMEAYSYKKVFSPGFPQMRQWIQELLQLCRHHCPALMKRLDEENVLPELYMDKWLITALTHNFPHRHVLRIWDIMLLGGSPKIILKACLAVLHSSESKLMAMRFEEIMPFLHKGFATPEDGVLDHSNPEPFVSLARGFRFVSIADSQPALDEDRRAPPVRPVRRRRRLRACLPSCFKEDRRRD